MKKFYCDICSEEMPSPDVTVTSESFKDGQTFVRTLDLCRGCDVKLKGEINRLRLEKMSA